MKNIVMVSLLALLVSGCAPLIIGSAAGVGVYRYEKCSKWVDTKYGPKKVWSCRHLLRGS